MLRLAHFTTTFLLILLASFSSAQKREPIPQGLAIKLTAFHPDVSSSEKLGDLAIELHSLGGHRGAQHAVDGPIKLTTAKDGVATVRLQLASKQVILRLEGDGVLAGRLLDKSGRAMAGVSIRCHWSSPISSESRDELGLTEAGLRTNESGEFSFTGMKPGHYRIAHTVGWRQRHWSAELFATDNTSIELPFAQRALSVQLLAADGSPRSLSTYSPSTSQSLPERYELLDLDNPDWFIGLRERFTKQNTLDHTQPELSLRVAPGKHYMFLLIPDEGPALWSRVHVTEEDESPRLELRLPGRAETGSLRIKIAQTFSTPAHHSHRFSIRPVGMEGPLLARDFRGLETNISLVPGEYSPVLH